MSVSNEFKEKAHRGMVVYPLEITLEELEFVEFVLQLYNVAEDTVPDFFENLLDRIKKLLKKMNEDLQNLLNKQELKQ